MRPPRILPSLVVSASVLAGTGAIAAAILWHAARTAVTFRRSADEVLTTAESMARLDVSIDRIENLMARSAAPDRTEADDEPFVRRRGDAHWDCRRMDLGSTRCHASVGPFRFTGPDEDDVPDWFRIDVERPFAGGSDVLFERDIAIHRLPPGALRMEAADIVTFDETTRTVTFRLGEIVETFTLPDR